MKYFQIGKYRPMIILFTAFLSLLCTTDGRNMNSKIENTTNEIKTFLKSKKGVYAVAFKDLQSGDMILINEQELFHAASTMKTPVMMEVFRQIENRKFGYEDSIDIKNNFKSIVDGSQFSIDSTDDSDKELYKLLGMKTTVHKLLIKMITLSSNLATNILIEKVNAENVTKTMRSIGANKIKILRGVEDGKAFSAGLNNVTTAYDLMIVFEHLAKQDILSKQSHTEMLGILFEQKFRDKIPAKLPATVKVANKTGSISNVEHDSGIVYLPDGRKYVLVMLSRELPDSSYGTEILAEISKIIYEKLYSNK